MIFFFKLYFLYQEYILGSCCAFIVARNPSKQRLFLHFARETILKIIETFACR